MRELVSHYVTYRKLVSTSTTDLLPEDQFRTYALVATFPEQLESEIDLQEVQQGVYDWWNGFVRIIVVPELPLHENNAPLLLFSARENQVEFGQREYDIQDATTSSLILQLFERYRSEGIQVVFTMEQYLTQARREFIESASLEDRRRLLELTKPEEWKELMKSCAPEIQQEIMKAVPTEQRLEGLSTDEIEEYLRKRKQQQSDETNGETS